MLVLSIFKNTSFSSSKCYYSTSNIVLPMVSDIYIEQKIYSDNAKSRDALIKCVLLSRNEIQKRPGLKIHRCWEGNPSQVNLGKLLVNLWNDGLLSNISLLCGIPDVYGGVISSRFGNKSQYLNEFCVEGEESGYYKMYQLIEKDQFGKNTVKSYRFCPLKEGDLSVLEGLVDKEKLYKHIQAYMKLSSRQLNQLTMRNPILRESVIDVDQRVALSYANRGAEEYSNGRIDEGDSYIHTAAKYARQAFDKTSESAFDELLTIKSVFENTYPSLDFKIDNRYTEGLIMRRKKACQLRDLLTRFREFYFEEYGYGSPVKNE